MQKENLIKVMQSELRQLNQEIDLRIVKGLSYQHAAKRHKFLMKQLSNLTHARAGLQRSGFWSFGFGF